MPKLGFLKGDAKAISIALNSGVSKLTIVEALQGVHRWR
jgi:hypothetical protein